MRSLVDMDTIQIEITNACRNKCSNCTRFCGHIDKPFYMDLDTFKKAVDSLEGYPKMIGIQGGEPLLHPAFETFCKYLQTKFDKKKLVLWSTFPRGMEKYREIICDTFYHIFLNDHTRPDIYHHPCLVAVEEVLTDKNIMWHNINHCWAQESWSASINPKGAFFCEMAASFAMLWDEEGGWPVEKDWFHKIPKDFTSQMEQYCPRCGFGIQALTLRSSAENIDDISPKNYERLKNSSKKIADGKYKLHNLQVDMNSQPKMAAYKDLDYRKGIAKRYDLGLFINEQNFWTPYLLENEISSEQVKDVSKKSLLEIYKEKYNK